MRVDINSLCVGLHSVLPFAIQTIVEVSYYDTSYLGALGMMHKFMCYRACLPALMSAPIYLNCFNQEFFLAFQTVHVLPPRIMIQVFHPILHLLVQMAICWCGGALLRQQKQNVSAQLIFTGCTC